MSADVVALPLTPERVREATSRVGEASAALAALGPERVTDALVAACEVLRGTTGPGAPEGRTLLERSAELSRPMVDWGMETTLATVTPAAVRALRAAMEQAAPAGMVGRGARLAVVILSGNVFTAPMRALLLPLTFGVPVVAKASSRDDAFARLLAAALRQVDREVAAGLEVMTFAGGEVALEDALFSAADVVSVYGSDRTLTTLRARTPATASFLAHGHGLGVAWVPAAALADEASADAAARALALDVAAYDQRGCLSPHAVLVERGSNVPARRFAERLAHVGLAELARTLPRGALSTNQGAAQMQWRGVAAARGHLFEGDGYATSFEGDGVLRLSPGGRNVGVYECRSRAEAMARLAPLGVHLKALGVAGGEAERRAVVAALPPQVSPRVSAAGTMQTPPFDAAVDGRLPWDGLVRWVDAR